MTQPTKPETPFWQVCLLLIFWLCAFAYVGTWGAQPEQQQPAGKHTATVLPYEAKR